MKAVEYRSRMCALATRLELQYRLKEEAAELRFLAEATKRRKYLRKKVIGPKDSTLLSPAIKKWMRQLRSQGLSYADIGRITKITNVGRISEACTGIAP
jgi:hypothetical protein